MRDRHPSPVLFSFLAGWRVAAGLWPVVLLLYAVDTALALMLAAPPATRLAEVFGRSAMAPDLLGPATLNLLVEATEGLEGFPLPGPLYLLVPLLSLLVGTFLRGGALAALADGPAVLRWPHFFAGCARFFGRLLLLLVASALLVVGLLLVGGGLLFGLLMDQGFPAGALAGGLLALLLLLFLAVVDYARISLVLEPERSLFHHIVRALAFLVLRFPGVAALALGYALVGALIAAAYPALAQISPIAEAFLPPVIVQQAVALLGAYQRLAALAGEMALFRSRRAT